MDSAGRAELVKRLAREVGFDLVGITGTSVPEAYQRYLRAIDAGYTAEMSWLADDPGLRADVRAVWPEARSVIALAVSYASDVPGYLASPPSEDEGWIARYAQGRDYHLVVRKMLVRLVRRLAQDETLGAIPSKEHRIFVDTGPVLEKAFAQAAGLGWIGKNTLLIHPGAKPDPDDDFSGGEGSGRGSWYFLATVLTPLELAPDAPGTDHCGSCTRCLEVCPTNAFPEPYVLDARRCIATWTIEVPEPERAIVPAQIGQHVFGCDLCQEVCPWNRKPKPSQHLELTPRPENVRPSLDDLASLDWVDYKRRFPKSAVRRILPHQMRQTIEAVRKGRTRT